jgi:mRNA interferase MazF
MVNPVWVPRRSEIIHLDDVGGAGHEQRGDRPHLVLTGQGYNAKTSLVTCLKLTRQIKGYPFEVGISGLNDPGVVLVDQVVTADWRTRKAFSRGFATKAEMEEVEGKLKTLLGLK